MMQERMFVDSILNLRNFRQVINVEASAFCAIQEVTNGSEDS